MIKNLGIRLNCDKRGKITTGIKSDSGYPKSTDYFVVNEFPEIIAEYGSKPNKLLIAFPINDISSIFDTNYVFYGGQTKIRQCDGETCVHRINETVNGISYSAGEESKCVCEDLEDPKKKCRCAMYLKAWVLKKDGKLLSPNVYLFYSGSLNTAANINGELEKIKLLNSEVLQHIPFGLSVEMVGGRDDAKKKFPIWSLQAVPRNQIEFQLQLPERSSNQIAEKTSAQVDWETPSSIITAIKEIRSLSDLVNFERQNKKRLEFFSGDEKNEIDLALTEAKKRVK